MSRTLFEISEDALALNALLEEIEGDISDPAVAEAIDEWLNEHNENLETKLDNYGALIKELDATAKARKEEAARIAALATVDTNKMKTGIELIAEERERQVSQEGWTPEHDDEHDRDELACSAVAYAAPARFRGGLHEIWPWQSCDFKPTPDNRVRELQKAGALIAAEIDRLQRVKEQANA